MLRLMRIVPFSSALLLLLLLVGCVEGPDDLTFEKLLERPELWPLEISLTEPHEAKFGRDQTESLPAGKTFGLSEVYEDILVGWDPDRGRAFNVPVARTDLVERARDVWRNGIPAEGRVARDLAGHLRTVQEDGSLEPLPEGLLHDKEVVVFYYSDTYRNENFATLPLVNERYAALGERYPEFEMVFVSRDPEEARFRLFVGNYQPAFPVLEYAERRRHPTVLQHDAGTPPSFIAVDRHGRTLAASDPWNADAQTPEEFLDTLESSLASGEWPN